MKNTKDKNIIKLIIIFVLFYVINHFFPSLTNNRLLNIFIKDLSFMICAMLLYFKELTTDYKRFRKSNKKFMVLLWALGIYALMYGIVIIANKYFNSIPNPYAGLRNYANMKELFDFSWYYALFKSVIYTSVAYLILYSLSFRKIINNNIIFAILSSLVFTFFGYVFIGFTGIDIVYLTIVRFIPYLLFNVAYIKNNNIVALMIINSLCNLVPFVVFLVK